MTSSFTNQPNPIPSQPHEEGPGFTDKPSAEARTLEPSLGPPGLGSLAQKVRLKQLDRARNILLFVGILTLIVNAAWMFMVPGSVEKELDMELAKNNMTRSMADPAWLEENEKMAVGIGLLIAGGAAALGVLFIIFGLIVKKFPVPVTITSLVLYILATILFGVLDPSTLAAGFILKIIFVVALAKAIQAALAYEKEASETEAAIEPGY